MNAPVLGRDGALPQGDAKHDAVEGMFDRLAPRYDRMNRIISLGPRPAVAPAHRRRARRPARRAGARPRVRHRRPLPRPRDAWLRRRRPRLLRRHARRRARRRRRSCAPTARALPFARPARSTASPAGSRCATSSTSTRCSPSAHACSAPAGASPPLDATVPVEPGDARRQRGLVPRRGAAARAGARARRRGVPLPPQEHRVPPVPRRRWRRGSATAGFADVRHTTFTGGSVLLLTGTRVMTTTPAPPALRAVTREVDPGRRRARRVRPRRLRVVAPPHPSRHLGCRRPHRRRRRRRRARGDRRPTTRSASRAPARSRSVHCRSTPMRPASW